jgi:hypothetical protein
MGMRAGGRRIAAAQLNRGRSDRFCPVALFGRAAAVPLALGPCACGSVPWENRGDGGMAWAVPVPQWAAALPLSVLRVEQRVGVSASCSCFADTHTAWLVGHHHEGSCRGKHGAAHGVPYRTVHVLLLLMGWAATVWGFPCSGLDFLFFLSRETSVFLTGQACFGLLFISSLAASVALSWLSKAGVLLLVN